MSDLCWVCQKNNGAIYKSISFPLVVKNAKLRKQQEHLDVVSMERNLYRTMVSESKTSAGDLELGPNEPCSRDVKAHCKCAL
jgi:hypothetical protein